MFTAEVIEDGLAEGWNMVENVAWVGVGNTTVEDSVKINVQNNKRYHIIITACIVSIVICLIVIVIMILIIVKRNTNQKS